MASASQNWQSANPP